MIKHPTEAILSGVALVIAGPFIAAVIAIKWLIDLRAPIHVVTRIGRSARPFRVGVRTPFGLRLPQSDRRVPGQWSDWSDRLLRRIKAESFVQLVNVLSGSMSLIGPRPSLPSEAAVFTSIEKRILDVRPGIIDFAAIVFADECEILRDSVDPELDYNRLIRPWKSRLGLFYIENRGFTLDRKLLVAALVSIISPHRGLRQVERLLAGLEAPAEIREIASRRTTLAPCPPPGATRPVTAEDICRSRTATA